MKRESFSIPTAWKIYCCEDCGCSFEARLLRGKQKKTSTPHLEAWMGPVNHCCHCGGTMVSELNLSRKELLALNEMLKRRQLRGAK